MLREPIPPLYEGEIIDLGAAPLPGSDFELQTTRLRCPPHRNWRVVEDVAQPPHRAICQIEMFTPKGGALHLHYGTGFLVAPRLVLTAAHNLIGRNTYFDLYFGRTPTGRLAFARSQKAKPHPDYDRSDALHDLAAIALPNDVVWQAIAQRIDYAAASKAELRTSPLMVAGYPIEDAPTASRSTQWANSGRAGTIGERKIFYAIDTADGMSGGPVLKSNETVPTAVGVHIQGDCPDNRGKLFEPDDIAQIKRWVANGLG